MENIKSDLKLDAPTEQVKGNLCQLCNGSGRESRCSVADLQIEDLCRAGQYEMHECRNGCSKPIYSICSRCAGGRFELEHLLPIEQKQNSSTEPLKYENGIPIQIIPYGYRIQSIDAERELLEEDRRNEFHSVPGYGSSIGNGTDGDGLSLNDYAPEGMDAVDGSND